MLTIRKAICYGFGLLAICATAAWSADDRTWSASLGLNYYSPDRYWDSAVGGEIGLQRWLTEDFGLGLHAGTSTWDLETVRGAVGGAPAELSAESDFTTFGGSFLYRSPMNKPRTLKLILDFGLEFVFLDGNGTFTVAPGGQPLTSGVDTQDAVNFRFGADLQREFRNGFIFFGGIGYVFNINEPSVEGRIQTPGRVYVSKEMFGQDSSRKSDAFLARIGIRKAF